MYGIYQYENGLRFTGKIAFTEEEAKNYLANKYAVEREYWTGKYNEDGTPEYITKLVPEYQKEAFEIIKLEIVGNNLEKFEKEYWTNF